MNSHADHAKSLLASGEARGEARFLKLFHYALFAVLLLAALYWLSSYLQRHIVPAENAYLAITSGDYSQAIVQLEEYAAAGDTKANTSLGNLYRLGLGVERNYKMAARLYSKSARLGDAAGMVNLALLYRDGLGVEKDAEIAYAWLNLGRESRSAVAQMYMSDLLTSLELGGNRVPEIRRLYSTIANMPELVFESAANQASYGMTETSPVSE